MGLSDEERATLAARLFEIVPEVLDAGLEEVWHEDGAAAAFSSTTVSKYTSMPLTMTPSPEVHSFRPARTRSMKCSRARRHSRGL